MAFVNQTKNTTNYRNQIKEGDTLEWRHALLYRWSDWTTKTWGDLAGVSFSGQTKNIMSWANQSKS